jgi:hypothetical protein
VQPGSQTGILREKVESITGTPGTCASRRRRVFAPRGIAGALSKALQPDQSIAGGSQKRRGPPGPRRSTSRLVRLLAAPEASWSHCPTATIPRSQVL